MLLQNIDALICNHKNHSLVQVITPKRLQRFQSIILGFDAYEDEILLGGIYPQPSPEMLEYLLEEQFWIQCNYKNQFLNIGARTNEIITSSDLISANIVESKMTNDRRWSPRAEFKSFHGPKVEVMPTHGEIERGEVKNISYHGAMLEFFGADLRKIISQGEFLNIRIFFNEQYVIETKVKVKQCFFRRKPCRHSGIRIEFSNSRDIDQMQIQEFVDLTTQPLVA